MRRDPDHDPPAQANAKSKEPQLKCVERLDASQISTAVRFLEFMLLDPVSRAIATAPTDDEPMTEAERQVVTEADEWLKHNEPIPHDEDLADLGLTAEDWDRMGNEPRRKNRLLKTSLGGMAKRLIWADQAKADIRAIYREPPDASLLQRFNTLTIRAVPALGSALSGVTFYSRRS